MPTLKCVGVRRSARAPTCAEHRPWAERGSVFTDKTIPWRRNTTTLRLAVLAALALPALLARCGDSPTSPLTKVAPEITSGTVPGGHRSLFFLTRPMDRLTFTGKFDPSLQPQVLVCTAVPCIAPVLGPIGLASTGAATLRLDTARQAYVFQWRTKAASLAPNAVYRLVVRVGDYQLGWVDLATGTKQRDLRGVNRREFLPVRLGSTVTLPFRIEQGAPFPPDLPGRYESTPDECRDGCPVHADPYGFALAVWAAVQITQTDQVKTGFLYSWTFWGDPVVLPPVPAPGTGPLNGAPEGDLTTLDWRRSGDDPNCLELWSYGMVWGGWCGMLGGPATIYPDLPPFDEFLRLNRLPNYLPPVE